jgi:Protein of unknown function (DUF1460)
MATIPRRTFLMAGSLGLAAGLGRAEPASKTKATGSSKLLLPLDTIFKGEAKYRALVKLAKTGQWSALPIGERIIKVAEELRGTPYENFTLEIDDRIESPSVNFHGLDCWTFFETCLGFARMIGKAAESYGPEDLLREIQFTRYRGGVCTGNYLERIHYLAEWFFENDARGTTRHLTPSLPGASRIHDRKVSEMTVLWKSYRYLRNNPELREPMGEIEKKIETLPVYQIPKNKVAAIEAQLQNGDVIGIATKYNGAFCSHVGLAKRTDDGVLRFMHASKNYKKVVVDASISEYLAEFSAHSGILVGRPLEVSETVTDPAIYQANLKKLLG